MLWYNKCIILIGWSIMDSVSYLKEQKMKVTKGRIAIIDILMDSEKAITVEYIFESCKGNGKFIDLSTVYRTLDTLESKDLVNKFDLGHGEYNYLLKEKAHKHIIECSCCHKEQEIDCPMVQVEELIKNKTGYSTMQHELRIKGICEECTKHK